MLAGRGEKVDDVASSEPRQQSSLQPVTAATNSTTSTPSTISSTRPSEQTETIESSPTTSWLNRVGSYISSFSPVKRISDEEYQDQLKDRRREVLERLREVEGQMVAEEAAQKKV